MQNMGISIALIVLIIIVGLIAGTRLSAPGSQRRAVTWAFGILAALVLCFFFFINIAPGDWIVPLFTVLCIVCPICVYVVVSRLPQTDGSTASNSSSRPRFFGRKDFTLPKGSPNTLQAKAPEGPKPPTAEERAAAEAAAAATSPVAKPSIAPAAPAKPASSPMPQPAAATPAKPKAETTKTPAAAQSHGHSKSELSKSFPKRTAETPTSTGTSAGVSGIPLTSQPLKDLPLSPEASSDAARKSKHDQDAPKKAPKIVEVDLRALSKTADASLSEATAESAISQEDVILNELPDTLKAPAPEAPSPEQAAAIIAAAEDFLAVNKMPEPAAATDASVANAEEASLTNVPAQLETDIENAEIDNDQPTEELPVLDVADVESDAIESLEETMELTEDLPSAPSQPSAAAPTAVPSTTPSSAPLPTPSPAPVPAEPKPKKQTDPYLAFRAKAAGLSSQGNYAVAAIIYSQAAQVAPTSKDSRNAKFDELACYVKADDIAKAKALATQLRQSSVLTRFERLKLDAVERMR